MQGWVFLNWCFLPLLILFWAACGLKKRAAVVRKHLKNKRSETKGDERAMLNLINQFIGKKCDILTLEKQYTGMIESVEENWIVVWDSYFDTREIINLEYVMGIRQCKEKAKKTAREK